MVASCLFCEKGKKLTVVRYYYYDNHEGGAAGLDLELVDGEYDCLPVGQ